MSMLPHNALVVVADGHGARLLRNVGPGDGRIELKEEKHLSPKNLKDDGPSGSRPEDQTPKQTDEATFAKQLTQALHKMKVDGEFESMVLVADPQTLGQMRDAMHKTLEAAILRSLPKDLMHHTSEQIADALK
jgi:protein required for attachment to host cells